jgi:hypothetical protein
MFRGPGSGFVCWFSFGFVVLSSGFDVLKH